MLEFHICRRQMAGKTMNNKKPSSLHLDPRDYQEFLKNRKKNIDAAKMNHAIVQKNLKKHAEKKLREHQS